MSSLYKRTGSAFWWLKFRVGGRTVRKSTGFRVDDQHETRKARELRREKEADEDAIPRECDHMQWGKWVVPYLQRAHDASPRTLDRKLGAWAYLADYLDAKKLPTPAHLTRQSCLEYVEWRKTAGNRPVCINTILLELRYFSSIVQEAVRRGWIPANPCFRLGIARQTPKEKAELKDSDIEIIRTAIAEKLANATTPEAKRNADFLATSFEIALGQGCRLSETYLSLEDINTDAMEITFLAKGRTHYKAPLNPTLLPLIEEMRKKRRRYTYVRPPVPSLVWWQFFEELRRKHPHLKRASFHSTRVTVPSILARSGVPEAVAMKLLNHKSTTVHRIYRRIAPSELGAVWDALKPLGKRPSNET